MKKKITITTSIFLLICMGVYIWSLSSSPGDRAYPLNMGSFVKTGQYKIDTESILSSLDHANLGVFTPLQTDLTTPVSTLHVDWKQADYLKISSALYKFVWNETPDNWALYRMEFHVTCKNNLVGFDAGEFYYYKESLVDGKRVYSTRAISVDPQYNSVTWGGDTYFPFHMVSEWRKIDLDELEVSAEEALSQVDKVGGKAIRMIVQNECYIYASIYPESRGYNWVISYGGNEKINNTYMLVPVK